VEGVSKIMLRSTALVATIGLGILAAPLAAEAQRAAKVPVVGYLHPGAASGSLVRLRVDEVRQGLRELGWVEGRNIAIEYRWAEGKFERFPDLAADLVRLKVDVIVTAGTEAALIAKRATSMIPIVMVDPGDPVASGLVASLAHPGGNATGLTTITPDLAAKRLQLLKEAVPKISRVAVLWNSALPAAEVALNEMQAAAVALGVELQSVKVQGPSEFENAFAAITKERTAALIVFPDPLTFIHRELIVNFAAKNRISAMSGAREFVDAGGLMSYGPNYPDMFRRAATYVDKILKGAKPADLPVEQPTRFELVINLKTAKALGLTIPQSILVRADQVIQ